MRYLVTKAQMQQYDQNTTDYFGIPAAVLMERAALAIAECTDMGLLQTCRPHRREAARKAVKKVLVLCGTGNNGADGLAAARLLAQQGKEVQILLTGNEHRRSELNKLQLQICEKYGISMTDNLLDAEYDMVVDALFGIGLHREVDEDMKALIRAVNLMPCPVVAVDIPSGVDADTGSVLGEAVCADITVTFGFEKLGMYRYPGRKLCGRIICREIGITRDSFLGDVPEHILTEKEDIVSFRKERPQDGNKGTFGKILLMAGQENMAGACILAARSCYRMGAGMVRILTCKANREILQEAVPEALLTVLDEKDSVEIQKRNIADAAAWADLVAAGPGIGTKKESADILKQLLDASRSKLLVLDADALNLISMDGKLLELVRERPKMSTVLTPHPGELSRLTGKTISQIKEGGSQAARRLVQELGCILAAKDAVTCVYAPEMPICFCTSGNAGMATAGSGDVLTGMISALCAFYGLKSKAEPFNHDKDTGVEDLRRSIFKAVVCAVYIHGMAGTIAAEHLTEESLMAGDLIEFIPQAVKLLKTPEEKRI